MMKNFLINKYLVISSFSLLLTIEPAAQQVQSQEDKTIKNDQQDLRIIQEEDAQFNSNAEQWSARLSEKLNLNSSQSDSVKAIMIDYQRQRAALGDDLSNDQVNEFNSTFNKRIEAVLKEDQLKDFITYSANWWNDINNGFTIPRFNYPQNDLNQQGRNKNNPGDIFEDGKKGSNPSGLNLRKT